MRTTRTGSILLLAVLAAGAAACGSSSSASKAGAVPTAAPATGSGSGGVATSSAGAVSVPEPAALAPRPTSTGDASTIGALVTPATADIVENGRIDVQLRTPAALRSAYVQISALAGSEGGFVAASSITETKRPTASMTLRIPDRTVRAVTGGITGLGRVTSQTMTGQDVSGQVVDLAVEITNLTSEETAVRHLLADAGSVRNILTVQQQLFDLQDEIQQLTAQSNSLDDRIRYATVAVALTTVATVTPPVRHHTTTIARFGQLAGRHTVALVRGAFLAVGWSAPGLGLLALVGGAFVVLRRRRTGPGPVAAGPDAAA